MASAQKRFMTVPPIHGHEALRDLLAGAHRRGALPSTLLLHGPPGVGKQRLGHWIGQRVLCSTPDEREPCGECRSCRLHLRLEHPDFHWYLPLPRLKVSGSPERLDQALEEARWTRLEELRNYPLQPVSHGETRGLHVGTVRNLRRRAHQRPSSGDHQVFLVGEAELLAAQEGGGEAANALLKVLEEPPSGTWFLLTSNEPGRVLPTIRSRSVQLHVPGLPASQVATFLSETAGVVEKEARKAATLAQGSIGRALGFVLDPNEDTAPLDELRRQAFRLVRAALEPDSKQRFALSLSYPVSGGRGMGELLAAVEVWLRDVAAVTSGAGERVMNVDARSALEELALRSSATPAWALAGLQAVQEARRMAMGNANPQLVVHGLLRGLEGPKRRKEHL